MGDYDRIFKENIEQLILPLSKKLLGLDIRSVKGLAATLSLTMERQPDFVKQVTDSDGNVFILHIEFQTDNDQRMATRMLVYLALLYEKYQLPIKQYVIYAGRHKMNMRNELDLGDTQHRFTVVNLQQISAEQLMSQAEQPEEVVLSILAHFDEKESSVIIRRILDTLKKLSDNKRQLKRYVKQLEILSNLRNLQQVTIQQIETMALVYDIRKDIRFQQGREEGREEERERAAQQTAEQLQQEKRIMARGMKQEGIAVEVIIRVSGLSEEEVNEL